MGNFEIIMVAVAISIIFSVIFVGIHELTKHGR